MGTLAEGIKEIFATAKTTGSNVMLCGNDGTPDGHMTMANLASVLGGLEAQPWEGGSFENLLRHNRQGVYYVDEDYNGIQSDMPFPYCVISINYISYGSNNNDVQAQAIAFNITNGEVKYKCVSGIGSDRDYPWRDVPVGLPTFYKNYANLSSLANALGVSALNSSSLFRIISGTVPRNQAVDVDCGNGLLFVGVFSECTLYWPFYWSTVVQRIAGAENTQYTVTKYEQSRVVHITAPSSYDVSYAYIGFTK